MIWSDTRILTSNEAVRNYHLTIQHFTNLELIQTSKFEFRICSSLLHITNNSNNHTLFFASLLLLFSSCGTSCCDNQIQPCSSLVDKSMCSLVTSSRPFLASHIVHSQAKSLRPRTSLDRIIASTVHPSTPNIHIFILEVLTTSISTQNIIIRCSRNDPPFDILKTNVRNQDSV